MSAYDNYMSSSFGMFPSSMTSGVSSALAASSGLDPLSYDPLNSTALGGTGSGLGSSEGGTMASAADAGMGGTGGRIGAGFSPLGSQSHSNAQATPFHYQSNANPITTLKTGFDYMKNDINVGQGFNSAKNLF